MKLKYLVELLKNAAEKGALNALAEGQQLKCQITKAEAYRLYGRGNVDRWVNEGLINPTRCKDNLLKKCLDRIKLEAVAASSNRTTYLPSAER